MRPGVPRLAVGVALVLLGAALAAGAAEVTLQGEGRVVALDRSKGSVAVEHGTLGRLFVAGLTEFPVEAPELLSGSAVVVPPASSSRVWPWPAPSRSGLVKSGAGGFP